MRFVPSNIMGLILKEKSSSWNNQGVIISSNTIKNVDMKSKQQNRFMVVKPNNRSSVHGIHLPSTRTLENVEEIEEIIKKGKKNIEEKRRRIEETVDSHLSSFDQLLKYP